jgi:hypothetical protein
MFAGAEYIRFSEVKAYNVNGVTATAKTWNIRELNTVETTNNDIGSLEATGLILLSPGVYTCTLFGSTYKMGLNNIGLYNITDNKIEFIGPQYRCENNDYKPATITMAAGLVKIANPSNFYVIHYATAANPFGYAAQVSAAYSNVYCIAEFWKIK